MSYHFSSRPHFDIFYQFFRIKIRISMMVSRTTKSKNFRGKIPGKFNKINYNRINCHCFMSPVSLFFCSKLMPKLILTKIEQPLFFNTGSSFGFADEKKIKTHKYLTFFSRCKVKVIVFSLALSHVKF